MRARAHDAQPPDSREVTAMAVGIIDVKSCFVETPAVVVARARWETGFPALLRPEPGGALGRTSQDYQPGGRRTNGSRRARPSIRALAADENGFARIEHATQEIRVIRVHQCPTAFTLPVTSWGGAGRPRTRWGQAPWRPAEAPPAPAPMQQPAPPFRRGAGRPHHPANAPPRRG